MLQTKIRDELVKGNEAFLNQKTTNDPTREKELRLSQVPKQKPHTIVLACADSRVPVEKIFSADTGSLFVIRTAGNRKFVVSRFAG